MDIGELVVRLGAKTDSSWASGLNKIKEMGLVANRITKSMGSAAREASLSNARAMRDISSSFNRVARDAERAASRIGSAFARENARLMANRGIRSAGNGAMAQLVSDLNNGGDTRVGRRPSGASGGGSNRRRRVSWAEAFLGAGGLPPGVMRNLQGGGGSNIDWANATGDPFGGGNGGGGVGGGAVPGAPSGRGRGQGRRGNGFRRFGALGEASSFRRVLLGAGIFQGLREFGSLADAYTNIQNRISGITNSQKEANDTFNRLRGIAANTRSSLETTSEAYVRVKNATEGMKLSSDDTFKFIERLNQAIVISGASSSEAKSGMMQLTQALAKGKLDGDEFRSIAENMPNILKILQNSLHVTEGRLRQMSKQGLLTREAIVKAFLDAKGLQEQYAKTAPTFASKWQVFKDSLMVTFGELTKNQDLVQNFGIVMEYLAKTFALLAKSLAFVIVNIGKFVKGLKDGKPWAYALATVIGVALVPEIIALATWFGRFVGAILGFPFARVAAIKAALKFGKGASVVEGVAGGLIGTAGKTAKRGGTGMWASLLGALGGPLGIGIALGATAGFASAESDGDDTPIGQRLLNLGRDEMKAKGDIASGSKSGFWHLLTGSVTGLGSGSNVNVGPTTVTIYANDAADAKAKFEADAIDRMNRHAAAAFNR